jgi:hypothetical protein
MKTDNTNDEFNAQLEAQGHQIAKLLDAKSQRLSMRILQQLEEGRTQAINRHKKQGGLAVNRDGTFTQWLSWADHHRMTMMGLVLLIIFAVSLPLQNLKTNETGDAFLLGADLPPEAFVDKGFEPALNQPAKL